MSAISPPYAPAFIKTPPPTVPGMPYKNSHPASDASRAATATDVSEAPAAAVTVLPFTETEFSFVVIITVPSIPPSSTRVFERLPRTAAPGFSRSAVTNSSVDSGNMILAAFPPVRNEEYFASGSLCLVINLTFSVRKILFILLYYFLRLMSTLFVLNFVTIYN